jgi:hypothetical protein
MFFTLFNPVLVLGSLQEIEIDIKQLIFVVFCIISFCQNWPRSYPKVILISNDSRVLFLAQTVPGTSVVLKSNIFV